MFNLGKFRNICWKFSSISLNVETSFWTVHCFFTLRHLSLGVKGRLKETYRIFSIPVADKKCIKKHENMLLNHLQYSRSKFLGRKISKFINFFSAGRDPTPVLLPPLTFNNEFLGLLSSHRSYCLDIGSSGLYRARHGPLIQLQTDFWSHTAPA